MLEFWFLKIERNVSLWPTKQHDRPKQHDVASRRAVNHPQYISWFDVSNNRHKYMNHWRQENDAKFTVNAKYTLCARIHKKYHKNNIFMSQPSLLFCTYFHQLRTYHAMGLVQTINKSYWRNFGCFRVFFVPFGTVPPAICEERHVLGFEITKLFRHTTTFFSGSVELGNSFWDVQTRAC